jgi:hypothetical protein
MGQHERTHRFQRVSRADDGTRTHDLLHGNATPSVTRFRLVPLPASLKLDSGVLGLQEAAGDGRTRKPNARRLQTSRSEHDRSESDTAPPSLFRRERGSRAGSRDRLLSLRERHTALTRWSSRPEPQIPVRRNSVGRGSPPRQRGLADRAPVSDRLFRGVRGGAAAGADHPRTCAPHGSAVDRSTDGEQAERREQSQDVTAARGELRQRQNVHRINRTRLSKARCEHSLKASRLADPRAGAV